MNESVETWYVKLANGDVHPVTIDQLDWAFQEGHVNADTLVLTAGADSWSRLGDVAGLDDDSSSSASSSTESSGRSESSEWDAPDVSTHPAPAVSAVAALADDDDLGDVYIPSASQAPSAPVVAAPSAPVPLAPVAVSHVAPVAAAPVAVPVVAPVAQVLTQPIIAPAIIGQVQPGAPRPVAYAAPASGRPAPYAPYSAPAVNSLRPVSIEADFDLSSVPFKSKSRKGWVVAALMAVMVAGGVGLAAQRGSFAAMSSPSTEPAVAQAAAPPPVEPHPYETPAPAATTNAAPVGDSPMNPRFNSQQFNSQVKDTPAKADKQHETKGKARASVGGGHGASSKPKSFTFTTGGNKYDPLNSTL